MCAKGGKVKETASEKELARVSAEYWDRFKTTFVPEEQRHLANLDRMKTDHAKEQLAGRFASEMRQRQPVVAPAAGGFDPGSGRFADAMAIGGAGEARGVGAAITGGKTASDSAAYEGEAGAIAMGRGLQSSGMRGLSRMAQLEQASAIADAQASTTAQAAGMSAVGTAAGFGLRKYMNSQQQQPFDAGQVKDAVYSAPRVDANPLGLRRAGSYA